MVDPLEASGRIAADVGFGVVPLLEPEEFEELIGALTELHEAARTDMELFFNLCIKGEKPLLTGEGKETLDLEVCEHQKLLLEFWNWHRESVVRKPIQMHKTYSVLALILWKLGNDPTLRALYCSRVEEMAMDHLGMVKQYIEDPDLSAPVRTVFPWLRRSRRPDDSWQAREITIDRRPGIRNASLRVMGEGSGRQGFRYDLAVVDDIVSDANSLTVEARTKTHKFFNDNVFSRMEKKPPGRVIVINTPWDLDDLTYRLEHQQKWPTMNMDVYGYVEFTNVNPKFLRAVQAAGLIVPVADDSGKYELASCVGLDEGDRTICHKILPPPEIAKLKEKLLPSDFARWYECKPFSESDARCQQAWIDRCKARGRGLRLERSYDGRNPTYTAVDVGIGQTALHDRTAIVTVELLPDKSRRILWIESGRWTGPEIVDRLEDQHKRYKSVVVVETNAAQKFLEQFLHKQNRKIRIRSHNTSPQNKYNLDFGVESIFGEVRAGEWIFPCDAESGEVDPELRVLFNAMLRHRPPPAHTNDSLMACWIAKEAMRRGGGARDGRQKTFGHVEMANTGGF